MTWIDHDLSGQLLTLCQSGESQKLDYKQEMPAQARDLAKAIAAFATSGGGLILLGVRDDGSTVGMPNADQPGVRDALSQRIAGICKAIDPPVRPRLRWAVANDQVVLAVDVPAGSEPMYYVDHKPYLRHETTCRPAKPSEVYAAVKAHTQEPADSGGNTNATLTRLAGVLVTLLRWAHTDSDARNLKPWVDEWEWDAKNAAGTLRDLAIEESVNGTELEAELRTLAEALDEVANFTHTLGSGRDFDEVTEHVGRIAQEMVDKRISPVPFSAEAEGSIRQAILKYSRKLKDLWARAEQAPFTNQVPQAQTESGEMGRRLVEFSFYGVTLLEGQLREQVREVGLRLFEIETRTMYCDGGDSQRRAIAEGLACSALLSDVAASIEKTQ
ncbi:MAG: ATP-binding protein [Burkholderiales bacterium]|nr:ATP-binding protein [Burkholderiales bacterium]